MGIGTIVTAALKKVPWTSLAMNYGPELLKKFKEQARSSDVDPEVAQFVEQAGERIRELETLVADQDKLIRQQQERLEVLDQTCQALEGRVRLFRVISALAALAALGAVGVLIAR